MFHLGHHSNRCHENNSFTDGGTASSSSKAALWANESNFKESPCTEGRGYCAEYHRQQDRNLKIVGCQQLGSRWLTPKWVTRQQKYCQRCQVHLHGQLGRREQQAATNWELVVYSTVLQAYLWICPPEEFIRLWLVFGSPKHKSTRMTLSGHASWCPSLSAGISCREKKSLGTIIYK